MSVAELLTPAQVEAAARLARLLLNEGEAAAFAAQLAPILARVQALDELDTSNVAPLARLSPIANVLRPDEARPSLGADLALREAPDAAGGFFRVPRVLGEGGGA